MTDCIIIGGGIIGLLSALELAKKGLKVSIFDRKQPGLESSWAGGGILSPLKPWLSPSIIADLTLYGQKYYQQISARLVAEVGIDPELQPSGLILINHKDLASAESWYTAQKLPILKLLEQDLLEKEPCLNKRIKQALSCPLISHVRNPRLIAGLRRLVVDSGVTIHAEESVDSLLIEKHQVLGVKTKYQKYMAKQVVIASGAWSGEVLKALNSEISVYPMRGQMLLYKGRPGLVNQILLNDDHYIIPRKDGHLLVGSTVEDVGFDQGITSQGFEVLAEAARDMVPIMSQFEPVKHWSGLRPAVRRALPYISKHPEVSGLYINCGHFRSGIILAPASARLLTELMLDQSPSFDPLLFSV